MMIQCKKWYLTSTIELKLSKSRLQSICTCPVAINIAATIFAECALYPPIDPAIADPIKFLFTLTSIKASALVLRV